MEKVYEYIIQKRETQVFHKYAMSMFNLTSNFRNANLNKILHCTQEKGKIRNTKYR